MLTAAVQFGWVLVCGSATGPTTSMNCRHLGSEITTTFRWRTHGCSTAPLAYLHLLIIQLLRQSCHVQIIIMRLHLNYLIKNRVHSFLVLNSAARNNMRHAGGGVLGVVARQHVRLLRTVEWLLKLATSVIVLLLPHLSLGLLGVRLWLLSAPICGTKVGLISAVLRLIWVDQLRIGLQVQILAQIAWQVEVGLNGGPDRIVVSVDWREQLPIFALLAESLITFLRFPLGSTVHYIIVLI